MANVLVRKDGMQFYVDSSQAKEWYNMGYEVLQPMLYSLSKKEVSEVSDGAVLEVATVEVAPTDIVSDAVPTVVIVGADDMEEPTSESVSIL